MIKIISPPDNWRNPCTIEGTSYEIECLRQIALSNDLEFRYIKEQGKIYMGQRNKAREHDPDQLTRHFHRSEFDCRCGTRVPSEWDDRTEKLAAALQKIRDKVGHPLQITSAYRPPAYNRSIGGAVNSFHTRAMAADIFAPALEGNYERMVLAIADAAEDVPEIGGIGRYWRSGFVHVDIRDYKARWDV